MAYHHKSIYCIPERQRNILLSTSYEYLHPYFIGIDYLRKLQGYCLVSFMRMLRRNDITLHRNNYYKILKGTLHTLSIFQIANICRLLGIHAHDCYMLGCALQRGETPDLSRYGIKPPTEAIASKQPTIKKDKKA